MIKLLLASVFIGNMSLTAYQPLTVQTDSTPCTPADGRFVHMDGVAISRDLHKKWGGPLKFGDVLYIEGVGIKIVNDVMHAKHMNHLDVFVWTQEEEAYYWKKFGKRTVKVWKVKFAESHKSK